MIVCPNCNHPNPDGAIQCEACYTPLPATTSCPNCGAPIQADASFCGQCGSKIESNSEESSITPNTIPLVPDQVTPDPLVEPDLLITNPLPESPASTPIPATVVSAPEPVATEEINTTPPPSEAIAVEEGNNAPLSQSSPTIAAPTSKTQLQLQKARLLHVQTNTNIELLSSLSVIHIGKQNDRIPPDVDVSGFPHSEIVSRIHADIRVEGDAYYIEDVGSSNGTYINNKPLATGDRHRLRTGDRIALGKGDLVTFIFQLS